MELRHLRYFVTAAEELNVSRASVRLRISQPAVSRQIRDLEDELRVDLFARDHTGLRLTRAGEVFLPQAREILKRSDEAVARMEPFRVPSKEPLVVGYISSALASVVTPALRTFGQTHPETQIDLMELSPTDQLVALREKKIDLAFPGTPCPSVAEEFEVTELFRTALAAVVSDHHHLALRKKLRLVELKSETFIGFCEDAFPDRNHLLEAACQQAGFVPRIERHAKNISAAVALVASGKGVTLMTTEAEHLPHPQAVFIPLQAPTPALVTSMARRRDDEREDLRAFVETVAAVKPFDSVPITLPPAASARTSPKALALS
jgi:LysR family transcriptional regulator, benzoate and cis,cis-muconate-responsive activator of ben and cat genes